GRKKAKTVKKPKNFGARLMNGSHNSSRTARSDAPPTMNLQGRNSAHDVVRSGAVESASRLVEEEKLRPSQDLYADTDPPLLPAAEAALVRRPPPAAAYPGVNGVGKAHLSYGHLGSLFLLRGRHGVGQLQLS
ncbi:hypothetical protein PanWU01x14_184740, partial [Parasponia andersonii]